MGRKIFQYELGTSFQWSDGQIIRLQTLNLSESGFEAEAIAVCQIVGTQLVVDVFSGESHKRGSLPALDQKHHRATLCRDAGTDPSAVVAEYFGAMGATLGEPFPNEWMLEDTTGEPDDPIGPAARELSGVNCRWERPTPGLLQVVRYGVELGTRKSEHGGYTEVLPVGKQLAMHGHQNEHGLWLLDSHDMAPGTQVLVQDSTSYKRIECPGQTFAGVERLARVEILRRLMQAGYGEWGRSLTQPVPGELVSPDSQDA